MSKYVDIEPIIRKIKYSMETGEIRGRIWFEMVLKDLEDQPTVDAVPVAHGHWIVIDNKDNKEGYMKMQCSVCGNKLWSVAPEELYCCKCGALMDEVAK